MFNNNGVPPNLDGHPFQNRPRSNYRNPQQNHHQNWNQNHFQPPPGLYQEQQNPSWNQQGSAGQYQPSAPQEPQNQSWNQQQQGSSGQYQPSQGQEQSYQNQQKGGSSGEQQRSEHGGQGQYDYNDPCQIDLDYFRKSLESANKRLLETEQKLESFLEKLHEMTQPVYENFQESIKKVQGFHSEATTILISYFVQIEMFETAVGNLFFLDRHRIAPYSSVLRSFGIKDIKLDERKATYKEYRAKMTRLVNEVTRSINNIWEAWDNHKYVTQGVNEDGVIIEEMDEDPEPNPVLVKLEELNRKVKDMEVSPTRRDVLEERFDQLERNYTSMEEKMQTILDMVSTAVFHGSFKDRASHDDQETQEEAEDQKDVRGGGSDQDRDHREASAVTEPIQRKRDHHDYRRSPNYEHQNGSSNGIKHDGYRSRDRTSEDRYSLRQESRLESRLENDEKVDNWGDPIPKSRGQEDHRDERSYGGAYSQYHYPNPREYQSPSQRRRRRHHSKDSRYSNQDYSRQDRSVQYRKYESSTYPYEDDWSRSSPPSSVERSNGYRDSSQNRQNGSNANETYHKGSYNGPGGYPDDDDDVGSSERPRRNSQVSSVQSNDVRNDSSRGNRAKRSNNTEYKGNCFKCGEQGHMKMNCPQKETICSNCRGIGHNQSQCPSDPRIEPTEMRNYRGGNKKRN